PGRGDRRGSGPQGGGGARGRRRSARSAGLTPDEVGGDGDGHAACRRREGVEGRVVERDSLTPVAPLGLRLELAGHPDAVDAGAAAAAVNVANDPVDPALEVARLLERADPDRAE